MPGKNDGSSWRQMGGNEPKRFTYSLTFAGLVIAGGVAAILLALFFVFGLAVGRGYQPEEKVPQLAEIMPKPGTEVQQEVKPAEEPKVLKPEELGFQEDLKKPVEPVVKPQPKVEVKVETKPAVKAKVEVKKPEPKAQEVKKPEPKPAPKPEPKPEPEKTAQGPLFDYVYQAAAIRNKANAEKLVKKIESMGYKAGIRIAKTKSGTWHRVLIYLRGTPDDTDKPRREIPKAIRTDKLVLKSKTPVKK